MDRLRFRHLRYSLLCVFLWMARLAFPAPLSPFAQAVPKLDTPTSDTLIAIMFVQSGGVSVPVPRREGEDIESWGRRLPGIPVVFALWQSGRMVWSKDMRWGGPPYYETNIAPEKTGTLVQVIDAEAAKLEIPVENSWPAGVLEGSEMHFLLRGCDTACAMDTGFEIQESRKNYPVVQLASGIVERLDGRTREEVLQNEPLEYRRFREFWLFAKKTLLDLIPKEGERENEDLRFSKKTVVEWKPLEIPKD